MRISWHALLVAVVVAVPLAALPSAPALAESSPVGVSISVEPAAKSVSAGDRFRFTSTVRNDTDRPLAGLIGHLNIVALDPDVYVDPEDWSSARTKYLDVLPAGGSTRLTWEVQAVGSGRFILYVGVAQRQAASSVAGSQPLRLDVSHRRVLGARSVLPLAGAVPAAVLVLLMTVARRRRQLR